MKKTNRIITFISVITIALSSFTTEAKEITNNGSSKYLLPETKVEFASFMNTRAKLFIMKNDAAWATFNEVVTSYNTSRSTFMEMSNVKKHNFLKAANSIQLKLDTMIGSKAEDWKRVVLQTTGVYKFSWESGVNEQDLIDVREITVPKLPTKVAVSSQVINKFDWGTELNESDLIDVESIIVPELGI